MDPSDVVLTSVQEVVTGDDFNIPSSEAVEAVETASKLIRWCTEEENKSKFSDFSIRLIKNLEACFNKSKSCSRTLNEELMWRVYQQLRVSDSFKEEWDLFLRTSIRQEASPTFFQFVSHRIFRQMIKQQHKISEPEKQSPSPITGEEKNAIRYVAGYVCRKVQFRIKSSSLPQKEDMILFITELSGDEADEEQGTEAWTNSIDRGGLRHINDDTYLLFLLMEENIRHYFKIECIKDLNDRTKDKVLEAVITHEDVCFQWSILSSTIADTAGSILLNELVKLYITIRGFAFASSCLELYKQEHNKKIQKSKALRRKLVTPSTD